MDTQKGMWACLQIYDFRDSVSKQVAAVCLYLEEDKTIDSKTLNFLLWLARKAAFFSSVQCFS